MFTIYEIEIFEHKWFFKTHVGHRKNATAVVWWFRHHRTIRRSLFFCYNDYSGILIICQSWMAYTRPPSPCWPAKIKLGSIRFLLQAHCGFWSNPSFVVVVLFVSFGLAWFLVITSDHPLCTETLLPLSPLSPIDGALMLPNLILSEIEKMIHPTVLIQMGTAVFRYTYQFSLISWRWAGQLGLIRPWKSGAAFRLGHCKSGNGMEAEGKAHRDA